jgi:hypothetical protein
MQQQLAFFLFTAPAGLVYQHDGQRDEHAEDDSATKNVSSREGNLGAFPLVDEGWGGAGRLPRAEHVRVPEWVVLILAVAADMAHVSFRPSSSSSSRLLSQLVCGDLVGDLRHGLGEAAAAGWGHADRGWRRMPTSSDLSGVQDRGRLLRPQKMGSRVEAVAWIGAGGACPSPPSGARGTV